MNVQDEQLQSLYELHRCAIRDIRDGCDVRDGMSTSGDDDGMRSSDANTNHMPNNYERTTNLDNIPSTKENAKHTNQGSRTNHI